MVKKRKQRAKSIGKRNTVSKKAGPKRRRKSVVKLRPRRQAGKTNPKKAVARKPKSELGSVTVTEETLAVDVSDDDLERTAGDTRQGVMTHTAQPFCVLTNCCQ
jgi:hypothetical protein